MKKRIILLPALIMAVSTLIFTGCSSDEDTTAPVITLNGPETLEIDLQEAYTEQGATATDGEDGSVTVNISGAVNNNLKGDYTITYTATDAAGNTGTAERVITVVNSADFIGGNYVNAIDSCVASGNSTFNATISISNTVNGEFSIANFGAFGASVSVTCLYNSSNNKITATIPQSLGGGANLINVYNSSGVTSNSPVIFKISYQWSDSGGLTDLCTSTYIK